MGFQLPETVASEIEPQTAHLLHPQTAATAALACMSLSRRRASPTFTPAAAASLMARDSAAVPTPSLQAEHTLCLWSTRCSPHSIALMLAVILAAPAHAGCTACTAPSRAATGCRAPCPTQHCPHLSARVRRASAAAARRQRCTASRPRAASGSSSSPHCSASSMQRSTAEEGWGKHELSERQRTHCNRSPSPPLGTALASRSDTCLGS